MTNTVNTRVGPVAYSDTGTGPVVLLLHATLHDRHDFDAITPELVRDYRVIALDWPGHGESPAPEGHPPTAASFADVLADVVTALDLPPATVIGNSVGGFAAARLAITHPHRVSRLVLVNSGGFQSSALTNLYCRALGIPAVMRRVLPGFIRSYMKAGGDTDRAVAERAITRARTREGADLEAARDVAQFRLPGPRSAARSGHDRRADADHLGIT